MSQIEKLGPGATFPRLELRAVGGQSIVLPDDIATDYALVLFYRGHW